VAELKPKEASIAPGMAGSTWKLLLQGGRRLRYASEERLHVVRVFHRLDPYSHFMVSAFATGTCEVWELVVSAEDAQASCGVTRQSDDISALRASTAAALLRACTVESVGGQRALTLQSGEGGALKVRLLTGSPVPAPAAPLQALEAPPPAAAVADADDGIVGDLEGGAGEEEEKSTAIVAKDPELLAEEALRTKLATPLTRTCVDLADDAFAGFAGVLRTGGRFLDLRSESGQETSRRSVLHTTVRRLAGLDLCITLEQLPGSRGHALSLYHPMSCTAFEVCTRTRDNACPEKFCIERVEIAGKQLMLVLSEAAFPHGVHVLVRDPSSGRELRWTVRDENVFGLLPRSHRQLLSRCAEELLQHGAVGEQGAGTRGFSESAAWGSDIGEVAESVAARAKRRYGGRSTGNERRGRRPCGRA